MSRGSKAAIEGPRGGSSQFLHGLRNSHFDVVHAQKMSRNVKKPLKREEKKLGTMHRRIIG